MKVGVKMYFPSYRTCKIIPYILKNLSIRHVNIHLEPVQGWQYRKMVLIKKGFQGLMSMFEILSEKNKFFNRSGVDPPPLIGDMSPD